MKKLYIIALIAGLSIEQNTFGFDLFKHRKLTSKLWVNRDKIEADITCLLENGYEEVPYNNCGKILGSETTDWKCYIKSPEGKCVIMKDYLNNK